MRRGVTDWLIFDDARKTPGTIPIVSINSLRDVLLSNGIKFDFEIKTPLLVSEWRRQPEYLMYKQDLLNLGISERYA